MLIIDGYRSPRAVGGVLGPVTGVNSAAPWWQLHSYAHSRLTGVYILPISDMIEKMKPEKRETEKS